LTALSICWAAKAFYKYFVFWRGKAFPLGSTTRPFIPPRQEFLRGTQLRTSEDVLASNDAFVGAPSEHNGVAERIARAPIIGVNCFCCKILMAAHGQTLCESRNKPIAYNLCWQDSGARFRHTPFCGANIFSAKANFHNCGNCSPPPVGRQRPACAKKISHKATEGKFNFAVLREISA
jgi:hypothetical protein